MPALSAYDATTKKFTKRALTIEVIQDLEGGIDRITKSTQDKISRQHEKLIAWLDGLRKFLEEVEFKTNQEEGNRGALISDIDELKEVLRLVRAYTSKNEDGRLA